MEDARSWMNVQCTKKSRKSCRSMANYNLAILAVLFILLFSTPHQRVFAQAWHSQSTNALLQARFSPENGEVHIGQFQQWHLQLLDHDSQPIFPAQIKIGGGMPEHGHGLPTQPQVTEYLGDGVYLIEGIKFNMAGKWLVIFEVTSTEQTGPIQFELDIEY